MRVRREEQGKAAEIAYAKFLWPVGRRAMWLEPGRQGGTPGWRTEGRLEEG